MHPMYQARTREADLCQGDIINSEALVRADALRGHQDYIAGRSDFKSFCVMTQTCDLVCKRCAEFIFLAVVRTVTNVFDPEHLKTSRGRDSATTLLGRIIEHQQNSRDYFFLHAEPDAGIDEDSVVDLRVMFSLHKKHYPQIREARRMGVTPLFAANLGWMAGYVFSRIAMPDWSELNQTEQKSDRIKRLVCDIEQRGVIPSELETADPRISVNSKAG
jgi:hypothetical protein